MKFLLNIIEGKTGKDIWSKIIDYIKTLKDEKYILSITKYEDQRTLQQNKYFHGVVCRQIIDEIEQWSTVEKAKCYIKESVNAVIATGVTIDGKEIHVYEQTSKMTKKRFSEFMKDVERWMLGEHQIIMQRPEDSGYSSDFFSF